MTVTGEVPDDDLAAIYTGAHAVVFPSGDEGFGLTPVEALACGTPVAACDIPADARGSRRARRADSRAMTSRSDQRRRGGHPPGAGALLVELGRRGGRHLGHLRVGRARTRPLARRAALTRTTFVESLLEQLLHRDVLDLGLDELLAARDVTGPVVERPRVGLGVQHDAVGPAERGSRRRPSGAAPWRSPGGGRCV